MEQRKRYYSLDDRTILTDSGHALSVEVRTGTGGSTSIGILRPHVGEVPKEVECVVSASGSYFYIHQFSDIHGFWLGFNEFLSVEELIADVVGRGGPSSPSYIEVTRDTPEGPVQHYRELLPFNMYDVRAARERRTKSTTECAIKDYLSYFFATQKREERRFNEVIAHTGRDLAWIMQKIGLWVPVEPDPIIPLTD